MPEPTDTLSFSDYTAVLKRRLPLFFFVLIACISASVLLAFGLPPVYQSAATILIEQQNIPTDLVRSTISSYADERIEVVSQRVLSPGNLAQLVHVHNLYPQLEDDGGVVARARKVKEGTFIEPISADVINPRSGRPTEATIAFTVTFEHESPRVARDVATHLTNLFIEENKRDRGEQAQEAVAFLEAQSDAARENIERLETQVAYFKVEYPDLLSRDLDLATLERNERRLSDTRTEIRREEERLRFLMDERTRLLEEAGGAVDRLAELQSEYARVSALYAPDHPDVVRLSKEIQMLTSSGEARGLAAETELAVVRQELALARENYSDDHPDVRRLVRRAEALEGAAKTAKSARVITSPAVRQIDSQIRETRAVLSALRSTRTELEQEIEDASLRIQNAPDIERQFAALTRRLEDATNEYTELQSKLHGARLSKELESRQMAERFELVESPRVPRQPTRPNRLGLLLLGFVISVALAAGFLAIAEVSDGSIRNSRDVIAALGVPPIASIPKLETRKDRMRKRVRQAAYAASIAAMIAATWVGLEHLQPDSGEQDRLSVEEASGGGR